MKHPDFLKYGNDDIKNIPSVTFMINTLKLSIIDEDSEKML